MHSHKENSCKNFAPNIFNKNKCQNCYKPRETHLLSDKDLNKAKPIYGGWLLLAPIGTDFNNPTQKNRKWQRRWFVLFEHGALRYALDNSETTVAQGTIDMNGCNDVTYAEPVTNQKHSLCISLSDQSYYIRGECKEDIMGWFDQLIVYPQTRKEDMRLKKRFKRKVVGVPHGSQDLSAVATSYSAPNTPVAKPKNTHHPHAKLAQTDAEPKSSTEGPVLGLRNNSSSIKSPSSEKANFIASYFTAKKGDVTDSNVANSSLNNSTHLEVDGKTDRLQTSGKSSIRNEVPSKDTRSSQIIINKSDTNRVAVDRQTTDSLQRDSTDGHSLRSERLQRNMSVSTSSLDSASSHSLAGSTDGSQTGSTKKKHFKDHNLSEMPTPIRISKPHYKEQKKELEKRTRARSPGRDEVEKLFGRERRRSRVINTFEAPQTDPSNKENNEPSDVPPDASHGNQAGSPVTRQTISASPRLATSIDPDREDRRGRSIIRRSTNKKQGTQNELPRSSAALRRAKSLDRSAYDSIHLSADLFNVKKGWLQTQRQDGTWSKHWFVLAQKEMKYFQDSIAEDSSSPDGIVDLTNFIEVIELDVQRNYGFQIKTSEKTHTFAAMTSGIRRNWMNAIQKSSLPTDVTVVDEWSTKLTEDKSKQIGSEQKLLKSSELKDLTTTERSQRRRARIRERRREGRSRTFDFAEFRPSVSEVFKENRATEDAADYGVKHEASKTRSRYFDQDSLLKDHRVETRKKKADVVDGRSKNTELEKRPLPEPRVSPDINVSIESEWRKVESLDSSLIADVPPLHNNPITETASMVKTLQCEVDSLKKQMERVQIERNQTHEELHLKANSFNENHVASMDGENNEKHKEKIDQQSHQIDKLKQELATAHETLRKQDSKLRECSMQLDISLSEAQLVETQLTNSQNDLHLEKSRREEAEKEHLRKVSALSKELEESETQLKKTETLHLDAQRKIRGLERQIHMQKDHNKEEELLQDHIGMLRRHAEEQEIEMREMQEAFEERCQNQKQLEDRLSEADRLNKSYEEQLHEMRESLKNTDKNIAIISAHRNDAQLGIKKLQAENEQLRSNGAKLNERIQNLVAQSQVDEDCNLSLQESLSKEKEDRQRLRALLDERDANFSANEKQLQKTTTALEEVSKRLKLTEDEKSTWQRKCNEFNSDNMKLKDEIAKLHHSDQATRELRSRLKAAEQQLREIEDIRFKTSSTSDSSFKTKLSELEAEMGGTGQMIAARLQSLEPSRRVSDPHIVVEKETQTHKIHRLESEIERRNKDLNEREDKLKRSEDKVKRMEERENEVEGLFTAKLEDLKATQSASSEGFEKNIIDLKMNADQLEEKLDAIKDCLQQLHSRVCLVYDASNTTGAVKMLDAVIEDILQISAGNFELSNSSPLLPALDADVGDKRWSRVTDPESRQQHQKRMLRLRQLTEQLKSADSRLVSPSAPPVSFTGQPTSSSSSLKSSIKVALLSRSKDLAISNQTESLDDDAAAQLFAKQISTQALLFAEMAATLRHNQSSPALVNIGRIESNFNHNNRQASASSHQPTAAEFSGTIPHHTAAGGLLQHVDALAQKLILEGVLMREMARLKETWLSSRAGRNISHRVLSSSSQPSSELSSAMVAHAHIGYVLQVYNERISRLSLEARQARHRADATMRKLRDLVTACKTQDLEAVSNLAVQVDTDSIAPPYSSMSPWEQQVDYGTLHGAQSMSPPSSSEAANLDQEAAFFHHLADDLRCMSVNVQSLSKLGAQLLQTDNALLKYLHPSEIGEHASIVAREAIVQSEVIYISHRLRGDYDEELRKAKNAVFEQSTHFEALKNKVKQSEENWAGKLKQVSEENNAKVSRLMQEAGRLEKARADMSKDVDDKLTRLSRKHEQELATCNAKHEQECSSLRKELAIAKNQLQAKSKEHMSEIKSLTQRLEQIQTQHRKESDEARNDYDRKYENSKAECARKVAKAKKENEAQVRKLKAEFENEFNEVEKEFADKLTSIEAAKKVEIESITKKHRSDMKTMKADRQAALAEAERSAKVKLESLKFDFDNLLKEEKAKHQLALQESCEKAESTMRDALKQKTNELKKEHDEALRNLNKRHKEQLDREKATWIEEAKLQMRSEHEVSHARSNSSASEGDSKEVLKTRIATLEKQLNSMQGQLENEQHHRSYQTQLNEIKTLCDDSFTSLEETHSKQLQDMAASHKRELDRLVEEQRRELESNKEDTRRVVEAMRKHHLDELRLLREQPPRSSSNQNDRFSDDVDKLNEEIETLSEHYSRKCIELANILEEKEKSEDALRSLERDNSRLRARKLPDQKFEIEMRNLKNSQDEQVAGDLYQLQVMLRVKTSEIDYLQQEITSLNKQLNESYQESKQANRKHKNLFEELTLSRSKEAMARREVTRLKERLSRRGIQSDDDLDEEEGCETKDTPGVNSGYDFQKSRSQPDFKPTLSMTPSNTSVKRRSSDRSGRHGKV